MLDYAQSLSQSGLGPWSSIEELGAEVVSGTPRQRERLDYGTDASALMTGVWECTQGSFSLTYPFNELATILEGNITISFPDGSEHSFGPGDTHFAQKGDRVTWTVHSEKVRKTFFIYMGDQVEVSAAAE